MMQRQDESDRLICEERGPKRLLCQISLQANPVDFFCHCCAHTEYRLLHLTLIQSLTCFQCWYSTPEPWWKTTPSLFKDTFSASTCPLLFLCKSASNPGTPLFLRPLLLDFRVVLRILLLDFSCSLKTYLLGFGAGDLWTSFTWF